MGGEQALTPTQRKVLALVAQGRTNRRIAEVLGVGVRTVENHRAHICKRLELRGPNALLIYALRQK